MRTLESHKVNGVNERLEITVVDEPGAGGANHQYRITIPEDARHPERGPTRVVALDFQNGPIRETGVNGITHEALLAILIDRLECFQLGPYANAFNKDALDCLRDAQTFLLARTRERQERGVEGTHTA